MAEEKIDTQAIEAHMTEALNQPLPRVRPLVLEGNKNRTAMASVDRKADSELYAIEAFVDEAIHARVSMMRGHYQPGPRDSYVRKMVLDAIFSIGASNAHNLD